MQKNIARTAVLLLVISLFLNACSPVPSGTSTDTPAPASNTGWLEIYFTSPGAVGSLGYQGGPDAALAAAIDSAVLSVDVAVYSLNLWSIRDALIHAHQRGVTVRMVMESDNMDASEVQDLITAGIPIVADQRQGLMHNKFTIIDRFDVWTGSMNYTVGSTYYDNNNLLHIRSVQVAEDYTNEFEEMFIQDHFGPDEVVNTPHPVVNIDGTRVEVYFSPDDSVQQHILALIQDAEQSAHFLAYSFTSDEIGRAINAASQRGLTVSGVMDAGSAATNEGTEYDLFRQEGLSVRLDGISGLMHDKVIILDESIVITGSYNFTSSAETHNDENLVVIYNPDAASRYMAEFQRILSAAQP